MNRWLVPLLLYAGCADRSLAIPERKTGPDLSISDGGAFDGGAFDAGAAGDLRARLAIMPASASVPMGHTQAFTANLPVTWSTSGGAIDSAGLYRAPYRLGNFTVSARSDDGQMATAEVTVTNLLLALFTGQLGGQGNLDGTGAAARFNMPFGATGDGQFLYTIDTVTRSLRRVELSSGAVSTIGSSPLFDPGEAWSTGFYGLALDGQGALYVSNQPHHDLFKVRLSDGTVTPFAGLADQSGAADGALADARFNRPGALALDGNHLYVSDTANSALRDIDLSQGTVSTVPTSGFFAGALWADHAGALFAAINGDLIRLDLGTHATTVVNTQLPQITGMTRAPGGTFYLTTGYNVYAADGSGGAAAPLTLTPSLRVGLGNYNGVAVDSSGMLFAVGQIDLTVYRIDPTAGTVAALAGTPSAATAPLYEVRALTSDSTSLYAVKASGQLDVIDPVGAQLTPLTGYAPQPVWFEPQDGPFSSALLSYPTDLVAFAGSLYVTGTDLSSAIRRVDLAAGQVTTLAGVPTNIYSPGTDRSGFADGVGRDARFAQPGGVTADGQGNLYVGDSGNNAVRKLVIATQAVSTIAGNGSAGTSDGFGASALFSQPSGVTMGGTNTLYVADSGNQTVRAIDLATGLVTTPFGAAGVSGSDDGVGGAARFNGPTGLFADGYGNLFVSDAGSSTVRVIELASGSVTTLVGVPGQEGVLLGPLPASLNLGVRIGQLPGGDLVFSDQVEASVLVARPEP